MASVKSFVSAQGLRVILLLILFPLSAVIVKFKWQTELAFGSLFFWIDQRSEIITEPYDCSHDYSIEIMSLDPVVLYLNKFLKASEIEHLLAITREQFSDSFVYLPNGTSVIDKQYRTSKSAMIPKKDPVSHCLDQRMKSLLGNIQHEYTERLQLVKYGKGEHFATHNDWLKHPLNYSSPGGPPRAYNRLASIFAYLDDQCTGGETYFPHVASVSPHADGEKFARTASGKGLLIRPRRGNAIFWNNMHMNGSGDERMDHASLPVHSGVKVGMNMFGLYFLDTPVVGAPEYDIKMSK